MYGLKVGRRVYTAPESVDDNHNVKPPEVVQPETRGGFQSFTAYLQSHPSFNEQPNLTYIPLKSQQVGSHVDGASLFNAPVPGNVNKLSTPSERGMDSLRKRFSEYDMRNNAISKGVPVVDTVRAFREPVNVTRGGVSEPESEFNRLDLLEVAMRGRL